MNFLSLTGSFFVFLQKVVSHETLSASLSNVTRAADACTFSETSRDFVSESDNSNNSVEIDVLPVGDYILSF